MLTLAVLRFLEAHGDDVPRKLLNFTDNRQDAALQAGHFNDFVQVSLLRAALYRAIADGRRRRARLHGPRPAVLDSARACRSTSTRRTPRPATAPKDEIDRALREVLAYRLYVDLRAGWRVTAPNLEQAGLLEVDYAYLDELCANEDEWAGRHEALAERDARGARRAGPCDPRPSAPRAGGQGRPARPGQPRHPLQPLQPEPDCPVGDRRGRAVPAGEEPGRVPPATQPQRRPATGSAYPPAASSASTSAAGRFGPRRSRPPTSTAVLDRAASRSSRSAGSSSRSSSATPTTAPARLPDPCLRPALEGRRRHPSRPVT